MPTLKNILPLVSLATLNLACPRIIFSGEPGDGSSTGFSTGVPSGDTTIVLTTESTLPDTTDQVPGSTSTLPGTTSTSETTEGAQETTETKDSTTGMGPPSICGDGILADVEQCDPGGNMNSPTCSADCRKTALIVFVTSRWFPINLEHEIDDDLWKNTGIDDAALACTAIAREAFPNRSIGKNAAYDADKNLNTTFMPWLSDDRFNPAEKFHHGCGFRYYLSDETTLVAEDFTALSTSETIAINKDEHQASWNNNAVLTNTNPDGTAISKTHHCAHWTETDVNSSHIGLINGVNQQWTDFSLILCGLIDNPKIYCFEQCPDD